MSEKDKIRKRIEELAQRAFQNGYVTHTQFLTAAEQADFLEAAGVPAGQAGVCVRTCASGASLGALCGTFRGTEWVLYGGWEEAERRVLCFLPDYLDAETFLAGEEAAPQAVSCMEVRAVNHRFAEPLSHRDYLGALMNLGIERDRIGDILAGAADPAQAKGQAMAYLFVMKDNAELIASELTQIRHTGVTCREVPAAECTIRPHYEEREGSVSSERLDAVLALVYQLSRARAQELVEAEQVFVDGRAAFSGGYDLKPGSRVSVRGYGKFQYLGLGARTKKGRFFARVKLWK